ncbi:MAG: hypothetical protein ABIA93_01960 [Candidatus Woesearchaeota archaeon]
MVNLDIAEIRKLPPEERIKALHELERKRKEELKKEQAEAKKDIRRARQLVESAKDEIALEEEIRQAREELEKQKEVTDEVKPVVVERQVETESLEEVVAKAPPAPKGRMYGDVIDEINRLQHVQQASISDLRELYSAVKEEAKDIAGTIYAPNRDDTTHDLYKVHPITRPEVFQQVREQVHNMPSDAWGYKERMESVLDSIYEMHKKERDDFYRRADHA